MLASFRKDIAAASTPVANRNTKGDRVDISAGVNVEIKKSQLEAEQRVRSQTARMQYSCLLSRMLKTVD